MKKLRNISERSKESGNRKSTLSKLLTRIKHIFIGKFVTILAVVVTNGCTSNEVKINLNKPTIFQHQLNQTSTETEILFEILDSKEARLQIQLRTPLSNTKITLINPSGHFVVESSHSNIIVLNKDTQKNPALGDLILLPEQLNPEVGIWRLLLTHSPAIGGEQIIITTSLLERFLLNLTADKQQGTVGQPLILSILAI